MTRRPTSLPDSTSDHSERERPVAYVPGGARAEAEAELAMRPSLLPDALFVHFVEAATDPIVLLGSNRHIEFANPAFRLLFPTYEDGMDWLHAVTPSARDRVGAEIVRSAGGENVRIAVPHAGADGEDALVDYRFFPLPGGRVGAIGRVRHPDEDLDLKLRRLEEEAAQRAELVEKLRAELTDSPFVDPVTGVPSLRHLQDRLAEETSRSARFGIPLTCLMVEVDGLKRVNQEEGAKTGDAILKAVAQRLKTMVRAHDVVARYGGGRFVVLAVQCDADGAKSLSLRLARDIAKTRFAVAGRMRRITVHVGASTNSRERPAAPQPDAMLIEAEKVLAEVQEGRIPGFESDPDA